MNPAVEDDIGAPADVHEILKRACYNCHSNTTRWPWYSHVAPVSWIVAHDVHEGRSKLNFSMWSQLSQKESGEAIWRVGEEVGHGEMPPFLYRLAHRDSALSDADRAVLRRWSETSGTRPVETDDDD